MVEKELKRLNDNPQFYDLYHQGIDSLKRSGVFEVLRLLGQPEFVFDGKDQAAMAAQAARAFGWNDAVNTLLNFEKTIEIALNPKTPPRFKYGGLDLAVSRGDITKEEEDAIKRGLPGLLQPTNKSKSPTPAGS